MQNKTILHVVVVVIVVVVEIVYVVGFSGTLQFRYKTIFVTAIVVVVVLFHLLLL